MYLGKVQYIHLYIPTPYSFRYVRLTGWVMILTRVPKPYHFDAAPAPKFMQSWVWFFVKH